MSRLRIDHFQRNSKPLSSLFFCSRYYCLLRAFQSVQSALCRFLNEISFPRFVRVKKCQVPPFHSSVNKYLKFFLRFRKQHHFFPIEILMRPIRFNLALQNLFDPHVAFLGLFACTFLKNSRHQSNDCCYFNLRTFRSFWPIIMKSFIPRLVMIDRNFRHVCSQ